MPLSKKGKKIMKSMKDQYGSKRGEQVFYASKNKGKIKGVEKKKKGGLGEKSGPPPKKGPSSQGIKVLKLKGGGMDASKPDFKSSASPFSSGYKGAKATSTTINRGGNSSGPKTKNITTGSVTTKGSESNITKAKNFVQNIGYQTQQLAANLLNIGKPKQKNLMDMRVTGREIGLQNQNLTGSERDIKTEQDIQSAFRQQGAYATERGIKKMAPGFTKIGATLLSKPLAEGTIRNRDFFTNQVLGNTKKGSLYGDKSFSGLTLGQRETMYGQYAKDRMSRKIDAFGRPKRPEGGGQQQNLCPDGSMPPCVDTTKAKSVTPGGRNPVTPYKFNFEYRDGGLVRGSGKVLKGKVKKARIY